jgi:hypothetical protein
MTICGNSSIVAEENCFYLFIYEEIVRHNDQCLIRDSLLTNKLMLQGFLQSRLQAAFRKVYSRYNDHVCRYNFRLGQMLSDVFYTNR